MSGEVHTTTDRNVIRKWVESRSGEPATVEGTSNRNEPGILRIQFPDYGDDENLSTISWDAFFEKFEDQRLAFVYQDTLKDGQVSRFSKFVSRDAD